MSSYTISNPALNPKRVFILRKSELEKRWDSYFYLPQFKILEAKLKTKNVKCISQIAERVFSGSTPLSKGDSYTEDKINGIPFVRSGDFTIEGSIDFNDLVYLKTEIHTTQLKSSQLKENDLLFAIVGATIGKVGVYKSDRPANINQAICAVRIKSNYNIDYLNAYFQTKLGQSLIDRIKRPVARANVNLDEISTLPIILPDEVIQQKVISIFNSSLSQKQTNEAEAEKLLASIDDYLLGELGITLPTPPENTLKNRMFIANSKDILGSRFDPHFNKTFYNEVFNSFSKSKFKISKIKEVLENIKTGTTPNQKLEPYADENGIVFLRNTNLKKYNIDLSDTKFIKNELAKELTYSVKDEVIMCIAGTVGLSAVNNIDKPFSINQNVSALKFFDNQINPDFASYWFNTAIFLELTKRACSVATIFYLNNDNLKLLPLPVPPLGKQKEIAEHITNIRNQAQALKNKTKDLLKTASEEIEEILLN